MKSIPDKLSQEYEPFFEEERRKIENGFTVNGVYIDGWLYWHTNHWNIYIDEENPITKALLRKFKNPLLRDNEWEFAEVRKKAKDERKGLIAVGTRRFAKALRNDSILYKDGGEITIGEVIVGDSIYGADGKLTTVTGVFPQGEKDIYEVELLDGRIIRCCEDHLWRVFDKHTQTWRVENLKWIKDRYKYKRVHSGYKDKVTRHIEETRFSIPNNSVVQYTEKDVFLDPYFLGLWLGDGGSRDVRITNIDKQVVDYIKDYSTKNNLEVKLDGDCTYLITSGKRGGNPTTKNIITNSLNQYNLFLNKHIPKDYLYNSFDKRLALLQGLMDSDGTVAKGGTISFSNSNKNLIDDVYFLVRSMGIPAKITKKKASYKKNNILVNCKDSYSIYLYTNLPVFRLSRKLSRIKLHTTPKSIKTSIVDIRYIGRDFATCITVDNDDHLFLTDGFTPTHNSEIESSIIGRAACLFEGSENVISAGNDKDLKLLSDKIDKGLTAVHPYFRWTRIENDWKRQVTMGIKTPDGTRMPFSSILPRNFDDGNNTEAAAGITAFEFIIDEIGKFPFLRCLEAAIPAFTSPFGWRCSPLLVGTGGSFEKGHDAEKIFLNPEAYNFLAIESKDEPKKFGFFLPGTYRMEGKDDCLLGEWLRDKRDVTLPKKSELYNLKFQRTNEEKVLKLIHKDREVAKKANDQQAYLKTVMYYPLTPEECFLTSSYNMFDGNAARIQRQKIFNNEIIGRNVFLERAADNSILLQPTNKKPITNWPAKPSDDKDAPVVIFEAPMKDPPLGLYVGGVDPYRQMTSEYSESLGAVYILKRTHDILSEKFQDMIVAYYVARPDNKEKWHEQARLLIELYNAKTLVENDEYSFIEYMKGINAAPIYLERQPDWIKEVSPGSKVKREYGVHRSNRMIVEHLHDLLKKYLEQVVSVETDDEGVVTSKVLGVNKVFDPVLLDEISRFYPEANTDRIIAFELALAMAAHLDPILRISSLESDPRINSLFKQERKNSVFGSNIDIFSRKKNSIKKLFG
jgi:hypothetical protein